MSIDATKERIAKLLAMARGNANENESATAMQMAMRLMLQHGLSEADFREGGKAQMAIEGKHTEADVRWMAWVHNAAAKLYGCKTVRYRGWGKQGDSLVFVGRSENIEVAEMTYLWLIEQVESFYKQALPRGLSKQARAEFRRTFKEACSLRVFDRAEKMMKEIIANDDMASQALALASPRQGTALVVQGHFEKLLQEVDDYFKAQGVKQSTRVTKVKYGSGTVAGSAAGDQVKLRKEVR